MKKVIVNNAAETFQAVAGYCVNNAPRGLSPRTRAEAIHAMELGGADYLRLEFERGANKVEMSVRYEPFRYEQVEQDGDTFMERRLQVELNWYSNGSCSAAQALAKAALFQEVALFGAEVEGLFDETYHQLLCTKEEKATRLLERQAKDLERVLLAACKDVMKGKRIGQFVDHVIAVDPVLQPLFKGSFVLTDRDKRYQVTVLEFHAVGSATVLRLDDVATVSPAQGSVLS